MERPAELISRRFAESIEAHRLMLESDELLKQTEAVAGEIVESYVRHEGTVYFFGNGGSAGDAQHLATELVSRFYLERRGMKAHALTTNASLLTAVANDYAYERVFLRQIETFVRPHDVVVGLSTSGRSKSVLLALLEARRRKATTVLLTGAPRPELLEVADHCLCVPSSDTPRIQECHILIGHVLCELVEHAMMEQ